MPERIGVAQVVHSLEVGGMERVAVYLATNLNKERYRSMIVCLTIRGDFAELAEKAGVEVVALGKEPGVDLILPFRLARLLKERKVRLIHAHNSGPWFTGTLAAKIGRIGPVVVTDHARPYPERMRVRLTEWVLSHGLRVVSVSRENREKLAKHLWLDQRNIRVIHNGVAPVPESSPAKLKALRRELGLSEEDFVFLSVVRLEKQKGLEILVESARLLKDSGFRGRILVVGGGSEEGALKEGIRKAGVEDVVRPTGRRMDVVDFYHLAHCFCLSSHWEGLPMAVLEALSAGLPILSTRVGDLPSAVQEDRNGSLVPPGNPEALYSAMKRISTMAPSELSAMGAQSRVIFDDLFRVEAMVRNYEELYEELL